MLFTVKVTYLDGNTDIKECHDLNEIPLDNVCTIKILREENEVDDSNANCKHFVCPIGKSK